MDSIVYRVIYHVFAILEIGHIAADQVNFDEFNTKKVFVFKKSQRP